MMLAAVKAALRISALTEAFDEEIEDLIAAARADLIRLGVAPELVDESNDPLIRRAIITYCKAHFGWDNPDAERLQAAWDIMRDELRRTGDYRAIS